MINWFNMPDEGLSNGGLFEVKELEVTENGTYETSGEMYNKVTVNVEGGGESDFSTAEVSMVNNSSHLAFMDCPSLINGYLSVGAETIKNTTLEFQAILYNGEGWAFIDLESNNAVVSENATMDEDGRITITGDFTITISDTPSA